MTDRKDSIQGDEYRTNAQDDEKSSKTGCSQLNTGNEGEGGVR